MDTHAPKLDIVNAASSPLPLLDRHEPRSRICFQGRKTSSVPCVADIKPDGPARNLAEKAVSRAFHTSGREYNEAIAIRFGGHARRREPPGGIAEIFNEFIPVLIGGRIFRHFSRASAPLAHAALFCRADSSGWRICQFGWRSKCARARLKTALKLLCQARRRREFKKRNKYDDLQKETSTG